MIKCLEESVNIDKEKKLNPFIYVRRYKKKCYSYRVPHTFCPIFILKCLQKSYLIDLKRNNNKKLFYQNFNPSLNINDRHKNKGNTLFYTMVLIKDGNSKHVAHA